MAYKELRELYYGHEEDYAQEYLNRFQSEDAVKIDFYIGSNQAFFLQNAEVMSLAYKIAKLDKDINILCRNLPIVALNQYSRKCLIDEIVLTNKIEGVHSSRKEIGEALDILENQSKEKKGKSSRFVGLVNKYLKLMDSEEIALQSCEDLRKAYDEIFLEEVLYEDPTNKPDGKLFRKNSVSVYSETGKEIHKGLMPEEKIIEAVDHALRFFNDETVDKLCRVCVFHYLIEYIHPFYDGNGRMGRFILSYGISNTLTSLIAFRISETIKENISAYYKAFKTCNAQQNLGDVTPFLIMQLTMILKAMGDLKTSLQERRATWDKYESAAQQYLEGKEKLTALYSILIQASLFSEMGIAMDELETVMEKKRNTIKKLMEEIPSDLISVKKKGHNKYYSIDLDKLDADILNGSLQKIREAE